MKGFSLVEKFQDPRDKAAIQAYLSNGGEIHRYGHSAHGECKPRKGIAIERTRKEVQPNYNQSRRDLMAVPTRCVHTPNGCHFEQDV